MAEDTSVVDELFEQVKDHFTDAAELATSLTRPYYGGSPNSANAFYKAVCGDRTLEKNHWFLDGSNPATITRIAVANDGKMTSHMQVNRADVETPTYSPSRRSSFPTTACRSMSRARPGSRFPPMPRSTSTHGSTTRTASGSRM